MSKKITKTHNPPPKFSGKIVYCSNGNISHKIPYVNDKKHGVETWWFDDGTKSRETYYILDIRHVTIAWDQTGNVIEAHLPKNITNAIYKSHALSKLKKPYQL